MTSAAILALINRLALESDGAMVQCRECKALIHGKPRELRHAKDCPVDEASAELKRRKRDEAQGG